MEGYGSAGARYGIWGVNPYGPDMATKAIEVGRGVSDMVKNHYENLFNKYKAQEYGQTLEGRIAAANSKNAADTKFYPLKEEASLGLTQANIKEVMSKTGLNYAQAQHALAEAARSRTMANPATEFDSIYKEWERSKPGTQRRKYLAGILDNAMMGVGAGKSTKTLTAGGLGAAPVGGGGGNNGIELNPMGGGARSGYHQGITQNPDGTNTVLESPTTNSASRNQLRSEAHSEIESIYPVVQKGLSNYRGPTADLQLSADVAIYNANPDSKAGKEAGKRLEEYALAKRFIAETASINARQSTGQSPGIEVLREFEGNMFPGVPGNLPSYFIPQDIQTKADSAYLPTQQKAVEKGLEQEKTGYPFETEKSPAWAPGSNRGYFSTYDDVPPNNRNEQQGPPQRTNNAPQQQQAYSPDQINAMAQAAIKNGADPRAVEERRQQLLRGGNAGQ